MAKFRRGHKSQRGKTGSMMIRIVLLLMILLALFFAFKKLAETPAEKPPAVVHPFEDAGGQ